jgi:hypothetical protein
VLQLLKETRKDGKSKNSLDWYSKRHCQTAKSLQFLSEAVKDELHNRKELFHTHMGCWRGEQNVFHPTQLGEQRQQPEFLII